MPHACGPPAPVRRSPARARREHEPRTPGRSHGPRIPALQRPRRAHCRRSGRTPPTWRRCWTTSSRQGPAPEAEGASGTRGAGGAALSGPKPCSRRATPSSSPRRRTLHCRRQGLGLGLPGPARQGLHRSRLPSRYPQRRALRLAGRRKWGSHARARPFLAGTRRERAHVTQTPTTRAATGAAPSCSGRGSAPPVARSTRPAPRKWHLARGVG